MVLHPGFPPPPTSTDTRKSRDLELRSAPHEYGRAGRYVIAIKVVDIFGNDTMSLVPVSVG